MTPRGLRCSVCTQPFRKGEKVVTTTFATYAGLVEGRPALDPHLAVITHMRHEGPVTAEAVREALKDGRVPVAMRGEVAR